MAWTTPRTWVASEFVTAALMNTHIRDNFNVLKTNISDDGVSWSGKWVRSTATVTVDTPLMDIAQTWNAGAVAFTLLKANVTNTASASTSLLMDLQVGGSTRFSVSPTQTKVSTALSADGITFLVTNSTSVSAGFRSENTFAGASGSATISLRKSNNAANARIADMVFGDGGVLSLRFLNDAENAATSWATITGSSSSITSIALSAPTISIGATQKLYFDGGSNTYITESAADLMDFWTGGSHRVRIDASGRLGIGALGETVLTDYALYVKTNAATWGQAILNNHATTPYGLTVDFGAATPNNATELFARFSDATAARFRFYSNGGLANFQANDVNLSDLGAKRGLRLAPERGGALRRVRAIEFVMDQYRDSNRAKPDLMWYAQQLQTIDRDFVEVWQREQPEQPEVRDEDGNVVSPYQPYRPQLLGTRDHQVFMTGILAIQELASTVDDHAARIKALEDKIAA